MPEPKTKYYYHIADVPLVPLTDKVGTRFIAGQNILCSFIEQPPGATFAIHSHPAEQILVILEGSEEHVCGDEKFTMKAGDVCVHPPNCPHGGSTPTGFKGLDIFSPPRADYLEMMRKHGLLK
jgi:quercetin dioxygenase-like cupin family protein